MAADLRDIVGDAILQGLFDWKADQEDGVSTLKRDHHMELGAIRRITPRLLTIEVFEEGDKHRRIHVQVSEVQ